MIVLFSWLIFALLVTSVVYFIYEGIVAPSLRTHFRYQMFAMRDELREMLADNEIPPDVYRAAQNQMNTAVNAMAHIHMSLLIQAHRVFKSDHQLSQQADAHRNLIRGFKNERFERLQRRFSHITMKILLTNSAGLLLWVVPPIWMMVTFAKIKHLTLKTLQVPCSRLDHFWGHPGNARATC